MIFKDAPDLIPATPKGQPWGNYDFAKDSLGVLALDGTGAGSIIWCVGGHLGVAIEEIGGDLSDLGLDYTHEAGIWIWEGRYYTWESHSVDCGTDYDSELRGDFRRPTADEWLAIQKGECPWNDDDWKLPTPKE